MHTAVQNGSVFSTKSSDSRNNEISLRSSNNTHHSTAKERELISKKGIKSQNKKWKMEEKRSSHAAHMWTPLIYRHTDLHIEFFFVFIPWTIYWFSRFGKDETFEKEGFDRKFAPSL